MTKRTPKNELQYDPTGRIFRIQPSEYIDNMWEGGHVGTKLPYPLYVDEKGMVGRQDVWAGDPYRVIGFQRDLAVQVIDLWWKEAAENPSLAVGMYMVTSDKKGTFGTHQTAIRDVDVVRDVGVTEER